MSAELNFFDTYILMAITEEIVPRQTFFKDRYFPTGDGDIFASDKVLTEYRKGDRKMAAFVSARAGDIPMERRGDPRIPACVHRTLPSADAGRSAQARLRRSNLRQQHPGTACRPSAA